MAKRAVENAIEDFIVGLPGGFVVEVYAVAEIGLKEDNVQNAAEQAQDRSERDRKGEERAEGEGVGRGGKGFRSTGFL